MYVSSGVPQGVVIWPPPRRRQAGEQTESLAGRHHGRGRPWPARFACHGGHRGSGVKGSPQGCRAQRDAQHPWGRRGGRRSWPARQGRGAAGV